MNLARTLARAAADLSRRIHLAAKVAPTLACSLWLACSTTARSQSLAINTLAGNATQGSADGFGSSARFNLPLGVTAENAGNIYVADTANSTIRKITPAGAVSTFAGLAGTFGSADGAGTNGRFYGPQGIAVDSVGFIYVADTANATIRRISPEGTVSLFAGSTGNANSLDGTGANAYFHQPEGLAVDGDDHVYVADAWNHTIRKITPAGVVTTLAGLAGNLGSADGTNSKARFNRPAAIALDGAANLYVTDSLNHTIRRITPGGAVSTIAGLAGVWGSADGTNSTARFFHPQGICAADAATLFVVDSGNQALRKLAANGTNWVVSTVAGLPGIAGFADGTGSAAQFGLPVGAALDAAGNLYLADSGNNAIRTTAVVEPLLQFSVAGNELALAWPSYLTGFVLETAGTVAAGAVWTPLTNGIAMAGNNFILTTNMAGAAAFYRLHKP
ncbi:MAG TPA: NHL repeat-containing protein [Candidatus Paceibacterota bacterium]|nr:NHL repeat-containing protein [Verrucomicrobiota bacterium]HSA09392.1 NHL repeat-containing protein [Candidatus Paceibacterota bacterium]